MRISQQVENILAVSRKARNSDRELLLIYFQKAGMELSEKQIAIFRDMPSTETIRRTRQQIQMEGKYPADQEVDVARFNKYKEMRQGAGITDPEKVLERVPLPWGGDY